MRDNLQATWEAIRWLVKHYPSASITVTIFFVLTVGGLIWAIHYMTLGCPDNHTIMVYVCTATTHGTTVCTPEWHTVGGCS